MQLFQIVIGIVLMSALSGINQQESTQKEWILFPKSDPYTADWKKVEEAEKKGLTKTALERVQAIYQKAKKQHNYPQQIKALIHITKYTEILEENGYQIIIRTLYEESVTAPYPVKPAIYSILAQYLNYYYQMNRYRIQQSVQSDTDSFNPEQWSEEKFKSEIRALYIASLTPADLLQRTPLFQFNDILDTAAGSKIYRPTLYDLFISRAIEHFGQQPWEERPQKEFELTDLRGLLPAGEFVQQTFDTPDSTSNLFFAVQLYQQWLRFHLSDRNPDARVDIDLLRLNFIRQYTLDEEKDKQYIETLTQMEKKYPNDSIVAQILYTMAEYYFEQPEDSVQNGLNNKQKAYALCEKAIRAFPHSRGGRNCAALKSRILTKHLQLETEKTIPPNQDFRLSIVYRNLKSAHFRLIRRSLPDGLPSDQIRTTDLLKMKSIRQWSQVLPPDEDFLSHRTEIRVQGLPLGYYTLIASADPSFRETGNGLAVLHFWVTNMTLVRPVMDNDDATFMICSSTNGKPIAGVQVTVYRQTYNYTKYQYEWKKSETLTTDENGRLTLGNKQQTEYLAFVLSFQNDRFIDYRYLDITADPPKRNQLITQFFTDRSIYRPGQTIYFKGIVYQTSEDQRHPKVLPSYKTQVIFYDPQTHKIDEKELITNEFGSFSGFFTAPASGLTGLMVIRNESGSTAISVEEYKRPRFEVTFQPVKQSYRLNEIVRVEGKARSYAGAAIDGASVRYRVIREGSFPYWWDDRSPVPAIRPKRITHGTLTTDAEGKFIIEFPALPDRQIPLRLKPEFRYTIYADVTDAGGETRSARTTVRVGVVAMIAEMDCPEFVPIGDSIRVLLQTSNLNGEKEPAEGKLTLVQLRQPDRVLRQRLWGKPDRPLLSKEEFERYFPLDVYQEEDQLAHWPVTEMIFDKTVSTQKKELYSVPVSSSMKQGMYRLTFETTDRYGTPITVEKYLTILSALTPEPAVRWPLYFYPLRSSLEVNDTLRLVIGSAYPDAEVSFVLEQDGRIFQQNIITLNQSQEILKIPVPEEYRGGVVCHVFMIKHQRFYHRSQQIHIPWSNKNLKLEFATFRDQLRPGEKERWRLTVKNPLADSIAAELVATLYDASLDAFRPHAWRWSVMPFYHYGKIYWRIESLSPINATAAGNQWNVYPDGYIQNYDAINFFGQSFSFGLTGKGLSEIAMFAEGARPARHSGFQEKGVKSVGSEKGEKNGDDTKKSEEPSETRTTDELDQIEYRTRLNETAFFYPDLRTNESGEWIIEFTIPEALTRWRMMGIAHTRDLQTGYIEKTLVTQKELMVQPNLPRFLREGDEFWYAATITNLTSSVQVVQARLSLFDAATLQPSDKICALSQPLQTLTLPPAASVPVFWKIKIPSGFSGLTCRIVAQAGSFSDGEENTLVVLPRKILVTESLPLPIRGKGSFAFEMKKLVESRKSSSLISDRLTLEMTPNPAWMAVLALPYLMEFPHECSEQVFSRIYANAMAAYIAQAYPPIHDIFQKWKNTPALESNLLKNEELKSILIQETPWLAQGLNESERRKNLGQLLDPEKMKEELKQSVKILQEQQLPNGAWPWFKGMPEDRFITQHIVAGFGHLRQMGIDLRQIGLEDKTLRKAIEYLDQKMADDYRNLLNQNPDMNKKHIGYIHMHYLYARSYFQKYTLPAPHRPAMEYWKKQAQAYWTDWNMTGRGMIALALHRMQDKETPFAILRSIKEHALYSEESGMYWKSDNRYFWYEAPIERQALLIEAFDEIAGDSVSVDAMKIWLLKQKQTQDWKTTKATAGACYALLRRGANWLASEPVLEVQLGNKRIHTQTNAEAGTGYFKTSWTRQEIEPSMGKITVRKKEEGIAWGALYWQYYEDMDKITAHATPLKITKKIFIRQTTDKGEKLLPVNDRQSIRIGDEVVVRLELQTDRAMEYVHVKDLRAAGLEPVNVLSGYRWQGGIGYYESTRDASTNFFIAYLPKGSYALEYSLRASLKGRFSSGIGTVQCMYAPEFSAHTAGPILTIEP